MLSEPRILTLPFLHQPQNRSLSEPSKVLSTHTHTRTPPHIAYFLYSARCKKRPSKRYRWRWCARFPFVRKHWPSTGPIMLYRKLLENEGFLHSAPLLPVAARMRTIHDPPCAVGPGNRESRTATQPCPFALPKGCFSLNPR